MLSRIITLLLCFVAIDLIAQNNNLSLYQGNQQYKLKNYELAQKYYEKAIEGGNSDFKTHFNLGDSYYKQGKYDDAAKKFEEIAETTKATKDKAKAYHNLGNTWLQKKDYQKSIDAYKNALKNNPADEDTRYNLAYAQKKLEEQNKKNQQNKDNKDNKDKKDDPNKDKDKDKKDDQNKDKKDDQKKEDKDKDKGDEKDKDKKEGDDNKDKKDQEQKANPKPAGIDKKQAEQILNAQNNREKELHKMMQAKKLKGEKSSKPEKDW